MSNENKHEELDAFIASLGLTYTATFIPQSASRNSQEKNKSINWRILISRNGRNLATDYTQGIGHVPGYVQWADTYEKRELKRAQEAAAESGEYPRKSSRFLTVKLPKPKLRDVLHSLLLDSSVLDHRTFASWASEYGYDTDSRKAETMYRACMTTAHEFESIIGRANLAKLQELFQDY